MVQVFIRQTDAIWSIETSTETFETTDEHPFWVVGEGFVAASELTVGSVLLSQGGQEIAVTGIRSEVRAATVYNFEVEEFHTYYVGTEKVLVHNACDKVNQASEDGANNLRPTQGAVSGPQVDRLAADMAENGFNRNYPVQVDGDLVVEGHHRVMAAEKAGVKIVTTPGTATSAKRAKALKSFEDIK